MEKEINIKLKKDEAIVLFDFISKFNSINKEICKPEQIALNELECSLEKVLLEPFLDNYDDLVLRAKNKLSSYFEG